MYLSRVLNSPQIIRYNDSIDDRLEHVFCLQNDMSDKFGHRKNAECCKLKIFSSNWRKMYKC